MPRVLTNLLLAGSFIGLAACANMNTIARTTELDSSGGNGKVVHLDIQQRLLIVNSEGNFCAEPSPDALAAYAAAFGIGASSPASGTASAAASGQSSVASIGLRTQSITLMRDALFRMCEAYANGGLGPAQIATLLGRSQDLTAVVLAVEQLTGAVVAQQAMLNPAANADAAASALATAKMLQIAIDNEQRQQERLEEAQQNLSDAQQALREAETDLATARSNRDAVHANTASTATQKQEADEDVNFNQRKRDRAAAQVTSAQTRVESRQKALDAARQAREAIQANQDAAVATASASTSSSGEFTSPAQRRVLSEKATEAIARSVEAMVKTVLAKDYSEDACMAMITYVPRAKTWSAKKQAHLERIQDICIDLLTASVTERIKRTTVIFAPDNLSDLIDTWLQTSGNRQLLRDWLKLQTPRVRVSVLLEGPHADLRKRAIRKFQIQ